MSPPRSPIMNRNVSERLDYLDKLNSSLVAENKGLLKSVKTLKDDKAMVENERDAAQRHATSLEEQMTELRRQMKSMESENHRISSKVSGEVNTLKNELELKMEQVRKLESVSKELDELKTQSQKQQVTIDDLKRQLALASQNDSAQQQLRDYQKVVDSLRSKLQASNAEMTKFKEESAFKLSDYDRLQSELTQVKSILTKTQQEFDQEKNVLESKLKDFSEELDRALQQNVQLETFLKQRDLQIESLKKQPSPQVSIEEFGRLKAAVEANKDLVQAKNAIIQDLTQQLNAQSNTDEEALVGLRQQVSTLEVQLAERDDALAQLRLEDETHITTIKDLRSKLMSTDSLRQKIDERDTQIEQCSVKIRELGAKLSELEDALHREVEAKEYAQSQVTSLEEQVKKLQQSQGEARDKDRMLIESQFETMASQLAELQKTVMESDVTIGNLRQESEDVREMVSEYESFVEQLGKMLSLEIPDGGSLMNSVSEHVKSMVSTLATTEDEAHKLRLEYDAILEEEKLSKQTIKKHDSIIADLSAQLKNALVERDQIQQEVEQVRASISKSLGDREHELVETHQKQLSVLETDLDAAQSELDAKSALISSLERELSQAREKFEDDVHSVSEQLKGERHHHALLKLQMEQVQQEYESILSDNKALQADIDRLKEQMDDVSRTQKSTEDEKNERIGSLESEMEELRATSSSQYETLMRDLDESNRKVAELEGQRTELMIHLEEQKAENGDLRATSDELARQLQQLTSERAVVESSKQELERARSDLTSQLEKARQELESKDELTADVQNRAMELQTQYEASIEELTQRLEKERAALVEILRLLKSSRADFFDGYVDDSYTETDGGDESDVEDVLVLISRSIRDLNVAMKQARAELESVQQGGLDAETKLNAVQQEFQQARQRERLLAEERNAFSSKVADLEEALATKSEELESVHLKTSESFKRVEQTEKSYQSRLAEIESTITRMIETGIGEFTVEIPEQARDDSSTRVFVALQQLGQQQHQSSDSLKQQIANTKQAYLETSEKLASLSVELEDREARIVELNGQKQVLEEQLNKMGTALNEKTAQWQRVSDANKRAQEEINSRTVEFESKREQLEKVNADLNRILDQERHKVDQIKAELQKENDSAVSSVTMLEQLLKDEKMRTQTLADQLRAKELALAEKEKTLAAFQNADASDTTVARIEELSQQLQQIEVEKNEITTLLRSATEELETTIQTAQNLKTSLTDREKEVSALRGDVRMFVEISLRHLKRTAFSSQLPPDMSKPSRWAELLEEWLTTVLPSRSSQNPSPVLQDDTSLVDSMMRENELLKGKVEELASTVASLRSDASTKISAETEFDIQTYKLRFEEDQRMIADLRHKLVEAHEQSRKLMKHIQDIEALHLKQLSDHTNRISQLEGELMDIQNTSKKETVENMDDSIVHYLTNSHDDSRLENLAEELDTTKRELVARDMEVKNLRMTELQYKSRTGDLSNQIAELEASMQHAERTINMLNEELERRQETIHRLRNDREALLSYADKKMTKLSDAVEPSPGLLEGEVESMANRVGDAVSLIDELVRHSKSMKDQSAPLTVSQLGKQDQRQPMLKSIMEPHALDGLLALITENEKEIALLRQALKKLLDDNSISATVLTTDMTYSLLREEIQQLRKVWEHEVNANDVLRRLLGELRVKYAKSEKELIRTLERIQYENGVHSIDLGNASANIELLAEKNATIDKLERELSELKLQLDNLIDQNVRYQEDAEKLQETRAL